MRERRRGKKFKDRYEFWNESHKKREMKSKKSERIYNKLARVGVETREGF